MDFPNSTNMCVCVNRYIYIYIHIDTYICISVLIQMYNKYVLYIIISLAMLKAKSRFTDEPFWNNQWCNSGQSCRSGARSMKSNSKSTVFRKIIIDYSLSKKNHNIYIFIYIYVQREYCKVIIVKFHRSVWWSAKFGFNKWHLLRSAHILWNFLAHVLC